MTSSTPQPHPWGGTNLGTQVWNSLNNIQEPPMKSKTHPGFKKAAQSVAKKQGISTKAASAIVAASSRNASAASNRANPRLKKVR